MRKIGSRKSWVILAVVAVGAYLSCFLASSRHEVTIDREVARSLPGGEPFEQAEEIGTPESANLLFVGDVMLSREVGRITKQKGDPDFPFALSFSTLRKSDITFGNLENPISERGANQGSEYSFRAATSSAAALSQAGFKVMSVANNHIWDYGSPALLDTVKLLRQNGVEPVGAGRNAKEANRPVWVTARGNRIAFLAFTNLYPKSLWAATSTPGVSSFDLTKIAETIREVRKSAEVVVVSMHFGTEYETNSNKVQQEIAHQLIDAGADLVVGHHPHVVEELEQYKQGWIIYSLGNFVFDQPFSLETLRGGALLVHLAKGRIVRVELYPVKIDPKTYQPSFESDLDFTLGKDTATD